jgi:hypothetical protein
MNMHYRSLNSGRGKRQKGFTATISVILLALGTITVSFSALSAVVLYVDSVTSRELRIQNSLNRRACMDTIKLMSLKDRFLKGRIFLREFGCTATVTSQSSAPDIRIERVQIHF